MQDKTKVKAAFAEAVLQTLWIKGFITSKERDRISKGVGDKIAKNNC